MERPFSIERIDHIVLFVKDLAKSTAFYTMLGGEARANEGRSTVMTIGANQRILLRAGEPLEVVEPHSDRTDPPVPFLS